MAAPEVDVVWVAVGDPGSPVEVTEAERAQASRFRRTEDASRFLHARALLRRVLAEASGAPALLLAFDRTCALCGGAHGKPRVVAPPEACALRFSVSHAGELAVVAFSRGVEVGVDVEARAEARDVEALAARFFAPAERSRDFLEVWTRKEAYLKLRGLGLAGPLERVDTTLWDGPPRPLADPLEPEGAPPFSIRPLALLAGHVGALAADGVPIVRIRHSSGGER